MNEFVEIMGKIAPYLFLAVISFEILILFLKRTNKKWYDKFSWFLEYL